MDLNGKFDLSFKSNNTKLNVLKNNARKIQNPCENKMPWHT
jgi:hypothetical protein